MVDRRQSRLSPTPTRQDNGGGAGCGRVGRTDSRIDRSIHGNRIVEYGAVGCRVVERRFRSVGVALVTSAVVMVSMAWAQTPTPRDYTKSCTSVGCHDRYTKDKVVHSPILQGACDACHKSTGTKDHRFKFTEEVTELCTDCHDEDEFEGKIRHAPFAGGDCTACHNPHSSDTKHLLTEASVGALCAECHEEITDDPTHLHGPVAAGDCVSCHNPHASDHPSLLFAENRAVCAKCHADVVKRIDTSTFSHEPAKEACLTCHNPHGGDTPMNLKMTTAELCLECHDEVADAIDDATTKHKPVSDPRSCANCHDPHASPHEHGLLKAPMALCLSCHDKEMGTGQHKTADIAKLLAENPNHHGPIAQKDCTACHLPHGSDQHRLLNASYPPRFYAAYDESRYALCFQCHDVEMVEDARTDEATGFRNGDRNLHYLHVNRSRKGRTCRACHTPHASTNPKLIAQSVRFGTWEIPINYDKTPQGGSCSPGCHKTYRYDRDTPIVNLPLPKTEPKPTPEQASD